jgi:type VI protein secretion system component VasK
VNDDEAALPAEVVAAAEAVFEPHDDAEEASVVAEMNSLYRNDLTMAIAFVVGLVVVLPFIVVALWSVMPGTGTKALLIASGVVLLVYNLTSMLYLVRNYRRDKDFIYRRDVAHLRELRTARRLETGGAA